MPNDEAPQPTSVPWVMPAKPDGKEASQIVVLANAAVPRLVRVCYLTGADGSHIDAQGNIHGGKVVPTRIYRGGCADIGGTVVELMNQQNTAASGTYEIVATDPNPKE